ncbi:class F sortase [Nocardiopsis sp. YSL2]|uniref:class F sortase n=1 Tax=Nocardiopsis sp. YSL2 TaxID=2939492 RepID=UPI0026F451A6|nr:class F sortase [Nocardiopsis sp. YSL2]
MGRHTRARRRGSSIAAAVTAVCAGTGVAFLTLGLGQAYAPATPTFEHRAPSAARPAEPTAPDSAAEPVALERSAPVGLSIPDIDVHTSRLVELGLTHDRRLEAPREWEAVGWYSLGAAPGQEGPAVLAGHLDSATGPAVFHRLGELRDRDTVSVERADGVEVNFTVYAVERYAKGDFPTEQVYGDTGRPELRLITCGGDFDAATGHYTDNVVVFAALAETPEAPDPP